MFRFTLNFKCLIYNARRSFCGVVNFSCYDKRSIKSNLFENCLYNNRCLVHNRLFHNGKNNKRSTDYNFSTTVYYLSALGVLCLGLTYAAVPLYRIFCQASGYGGTISTDKDSDVSKMKKVKHREITVQFNADVSSSLRWNFRPQQSEITVFPGETALAFYTAENPADKPVIGVSTYNVVPFEAGQYFNKIQCFCFEEQMLNPHEQVDMPVFFYIDPEFSEDPQMEFVNNIVLSYTFFEVKEGMNLPIPGYYQPHKR